MLHLQVADLSMKPGGNRTAPAWQFNSGTLNDRLLRLAEAKADGNYARVLDDADDILKTDPNNKEALNAKALAQDRTKDYKGALKTAEEAIKNDPENAAAYANKAYALGALGNRNGMVEALKTAASLDPRFQAALDNVLSNGSASLFDMPGEVLESKMQGTKAKESAGLTPEMLKWIVLAALGLPLMAVVLFFLLRNAFPKAAPLAASSSLTVVDAAPLRNLILIEQTGILPELYGRVVIPEAAAEELRRSSSPPAVAAWIARPPGWLEIRRLGRPQADGSLGILGEAERSAILLALELQAPLLIIDGQFGLQEAARRRLKASGTLAVMEQAAQRGLLDFPTVLKRLQTASAVPAAKDASAVAAKTERLQEKFELGPRIGAGGMGMVFAGKDISLNRKVAIKKMLPQLAAQPKLRERFVAEARTVAALHHPNIVDIFAVVEESQDLYLIFEYIEGKTLADLIFARGKLPFQESVNIIRDIARALDFAHGQGIIHRDLKPSNVMQDGSGRVVVMDFGLARTVQDWMSQAALTNTVVGTPAYMAPEQENGVVCKQSDVYSLGICLYEMLSGKRPFDGSPAAMLASKTAMKYVPISKLSSLLPAGLDIFFTCALTADPKKRPATPKKFVAALDALTPVPASS